MDNYEQIFYLDCPHFTVGHVDQWGEQGYLLFEDKVYSYDEDRKNQCGTTHSPTTIKDFLKYAGEQQITIPNDFFEEINGGSRVNLREVIIDSSTISEDLVLYAKRINGQLLPSSEAILLELTEEEQEMNTDEVANRKCPGFNYCIEMFLIQEMMQDLDALGERMDMDKKIDRVIYYIEYDA